MRFRTPNSEDQATANNNGGSYSTTSTSQNTTSQNASAASPPSHSTQQQQQPSSSANDNGSSARPHQARPTARVTPNSRDSKSSSFVPLANNLPSSSSSSTRSKSARTRREADQPQQQQRINEGATRDAESSTSSRPKRGQPDGAPDPAASTSPFAVPPTTTHQTR